VHGEGTGVFLLPPGADAAQGLRLFPEDKAECHVQAAYREKEKCRDKRVLVNMMGKNCGANSVAVRSSSDKQRKKPRKNVQSLEYSKCAEAELCTEYREKVVEEGHWPRDLGQEEEEELQDDKKTVYDGPEDTCGLIGDGATAKEDTSR
jgi:hypothetical protein